MYIYYPSCNFSIASPSTAKVVRNLLKEKMVVAGCCLRDQREIHEDDIGVYFCQHCRETIENKVKTMSLWEYIDSLEDFDFPDYNHEKMLLQDCYRDRNHPEVHQAVRSILQKMNVDVVEAKRNKENSVYCGTLQKELMEDNFEGVDLDMQIIVDCNRCLKGVELAGRKGIHLLNLVMKNYL